MSEHEESLPVENEVKSRFGILELILLLAMHFLLYQMVPSTFTNLQTGFDRTLTALDFTKWSKVTWFLANFTIVAFLMLIRFGPSIKAKWEQAKERIREKQKAQKVNLDEAKKLKEIEEQKVMLERLEEGRSRRMY